MLFYIKLNRDNMQFVVTVITCHWWKW